MPFAIQVSHQPSLPGRRVPLLLQFAGCILQFAFCIHLAVAADVRYVAVLGDGSRVEGKEIRNWGNSRENPQLDGKELLSPSRPFRWLRDLTATTDEPRREASGLVELIGGDRFLGRVTGFVPGGTDERPAVPPHLLVALEGPLLYAGSPLTAEAGGGQRTQVRVLPQFVRRIVWGKGRSGDIEPGLLLLRDGGRLACQSLRWQADGVRVLTADGIRQVPLAELSEVCLPQADAWQSYCAELAALDPECKSRLVRLATTRGCILSTSLPHLEATGGWDRTAWCHVVRPAWCLDALCVPFATIRAWWTFAPHEVPLSRVAAGAFRLPSHARQRMVVATRSQRRGGLVGRRESRSTAGVLGSTPRVSCGSRSLPQREGFRCGWDWTGWPARGVVPGPWSAWTGRTPHRGFAAST